MMRSLYSGVAGLKTHQTRMDVIGNNIANVNTVAFKGQSMTFSELMYQTTQGASGANPQTGTAGVNARQIGLGVKTAAISTAITTQGATQTTGNPFDLKITGSAFFIVNNGQQNFFTRDGAFGVDSFGNLATTAGGLNVMGWQAITDPITGREMIRQDTVSALRILSPENMTFPPEATTRAFVSGIIDRNDRQVESEAGRIMNLGFFDELGYAYTARLSMRAVMEDDPTFPTPLVLNPEFATDPTVIEWIPSTTGHGAAGWVLNAAGDEWELDPTFPIPQAAVRGQYSVALTGILDERGVDVTARFPGITFGGVAVGDASNIVTYSEATGLFVSVGAAAGPALTLDFGAGNVFPAGPFPAVGINVDFSRSTNFNNNGTSTIATTSGDVDGTGRGRRLGELTGVSIDRSGMIFATYDNGQSRLLGQIAVAEFPNASGLSKEGDNLYGVTMNSGEFNGIGVDITSNGGFMSTGVLEMSNVDLAAEFTEMITTQKGFQANSRIITVSDGMLEELVNLKR